MGRRAAPLVPRQVVVNGVVQWAVRVPASFRNQEGVKDGRKYLGTEAIARGYCKKPGRLASSITAQDVHG